MSATNIEVSRGYPKAHMYTFPLRYKEGVVCLQNDEDQIDIGLETDQFKHEEIKVTLKDREVTIDCSHKEEEEEDDDDVMEGPPKGYEMHRRFTFSGDVDVGTVKCTLNNKGVLEIFADKMNRRDSYKRNY